MKKDLYLMRHGQTLFNVRRRIQGWCDSPLTELGKQQALKAKEYLKEVGLKGEEESIVNTLSGGMKRRVSICRFLLVPSSLYLLDEPFSAMDEETIITTSRLIKRVVENKTTVVVTHNPLVKEILDAKLVVSL